MVRPGWWTPREGGYRHQALRVDERLAEQCLYNLVERHVEEEVIPAALHYGVGIIPWSPLMRGLLGGILGKQRDTGRSASETTQSLLVRHREKIERYEALCAQLGEHPSAVGLAWLLRQPGVTGPIVGPRTTEQFQSNLHALKFTSTTRRWNSWRRSFPVRGRLPRSGPGSDQGQAPATDVLVRSKRTTGPSVKKVAVASSTPRMTRPSMPSRCAAKPPMTAPSAPPPAKATV